MPAFEDDLPLLGPHTRFGDEVVVFAGQSKRATWHTDARCRWFARHAHAPIQIWSVVEGLVSFLSGTGREHRDPCAACARPVLLDLAVREAAADPGRSARLVLGCPKARIAQDGSHARCPSCAALRDLARRADAVAHTSAEGHQLVYLTLRRELRSVAASAYVCYPVPAEVTEVTSELLGVAWTLRREGRGKGPATLPALKDWNDFWSPQDTLGWEVGALVTAPAVGA